MRLFFLLIALFSLLPAALAANDPGHDSLYVLLTGDSNVTGSLNLTGTLNASFVRAATLLYGDQLDIRANGTILSVSSRPAIQADSSDLYLDSTGNIYLATRGGTTGIVQVGPTSGESITLNVSGAIYERNVRVCLANGTNCPAGAGETGNVTGSGTTNTVPKWVSATELGDSNIVDDGNVSVNTDAFFVDTTKRRAGIGTDTPSAALHINNGTGALTTGIVFGDGDSGFYEVSDDVLLARRTLSDSDSIFGVVGSSDSGTVRLYLGSSGSASGAPSGIVSGSSQLIFLTDTDGNQGAGSAFIFGTDGSSSSFTELMRLESTGWLGLGSSSPLSTLHVNSSASGGSFRVQSTNGDVHLFVNGTSGNVGIRKLAPGNELEVVGTINASALQVGTTDVCLSDGTNCPAGASGNGWTNTSTTTSTNLNVVVNSGNLTISSSAGHLVLPQANGASTPSLSFGDRDSGIYEASDDRLQLALGGSDRIDFLTTHMGMSISSGAKMMFETPSSTNPVFTFAGDEDTGIGRGGTDNLNLIVGGKSAVTIDGEGFVGINTTTPQGILHFNGAAFDFLISSSGVGVNTITPGNELEVVGTVNASAIQVGTTDVCLSDGTNCPADAIDGSGSANSVAKWSDSNTLTNSIISDNGNITIDTNTLFLDAANNFVGFGTVSPSEKVHVSGNIKISGSAPNLVINETDAGANNTQWRIRSVGGVLRIQALDDGNTGGGNVIDIGRIDEQISYVQIGAAASPALYANASDVLVGIGTTTPTHELNVIGDVNVTGDAYLANYDLRIFDSGGIPTIAHQSGTGIFIESLLPITTATYDLGSSTFRWRNGYMNGNLSVTDGRIVINNTGIGEDRGISVLANATRQSLVNMGDQNNVSVGALRYDHATDAMVLVTNNSDRVQVSGTGHVLVSGNGAPSLSSCGTSPSISGNDVAGKITVGTITSTCTLTFNASYAAAPACIVTGDQSSVTYAASTTTSALTITSSGDMGSDVIMYHCLEFG